MRNVGKHTPKSKTHREYYTKVIKNLDYEPTVDDTLKFAQSDDNDRDFSLPKSSAKRKVPFKYQIQDHWNDNWIRYIISILTIILFYLMIGSKIDISTIHTNIQFLKGDVKELKELENKNTEMQHKQDLEIQENKLKLESLEDKVKNANKSIKGN